MRRTDLLCKLLEPLFIALVDGACTEIAIIVNSAMNAAFVLIEYFAIVRFCYDVTELQLPKKKQRLESHGAAGPAEIQRRSKHTRCHVKETRQNSVTDFNLYFHHGAFLPSITDALPYLPVLNCAGQMVT